MGLAHECCCCSFAECFFIDEGILNKDLVFQTASYNQRLKIWYRKQIWRFWKWPSSVKLFEHLNQESKAQQLYLIWLFFIYWYGISSKKQFNSNVKNTISNSIPIFKGFVKQDEKFRSLTARAFTKHKTNTNW